MKTLQAQVPDILIEEVNELAEKQNASVDQIVSLALAAQVSAWRTRESIASRAHRVDWQKVDEILARVPDVPAQPGDDLSETEALKQVPVAKPKKARVPKRPFSETEELKQHLLASDAKFAELAETHSRYEKRLSELAALHNRSTEVQTEEATLKKKKLFLKDQMELILRRYKEQTTGH